MLVLLMRGIYEVRHLDGLRYHDVHAKFHKYWLRLSKTSGEDGRRHTDNKVIA
jgi:hypothetical protein